LLGLCGYENEGPGSKKKQRKQVINLSFGRSGRERESKKQEDKNARAPGVATDKGRGGDILLHLSNRP